MKIIYSWGHALKELIPVLETEVQEWIQAGFNITSINDRKELGIKIPWKPPELDKLYHDKDSKLMKLYNMVESLANTHDILITNHGNVYHPGFIKSLKNKGIYTVICSADDPEDSDYCSKPYVHAFNHSFSWGINFDEKTRITTKFLEWGAERADIWPYGIRHDMFDPSLTVNDIFNKNREIDIIYVGSLIYKVDRIAELKKAFPQMKVFGRNWNLKTLLKSPISYWRHYGKVDWKKFQGAILAIREGLARVNTLPTREIVPYYQNSKIGINFHMSFGPSNRRTYELPANGVLQICDCPEGIGFLFDINKEVVVYHSVKEAIQLIKYYLEHDNERKKIAASGFSRALKDYNRLTTFSNAIQKIKKGMLENGLNHFKNGESIIVADHK